jgi:quinol monooxygenase YgiN
LATLFARHTVSDYASWKKFYDGFDATRKSMGVTSDGVYQAAANPNDLTIYHEFGSLEAAEAFVNSPELKSAMQQAGVVGAPDIWITNHV